MGRKVISFLIQLSVKTSSSSGCEYLRNNFGVQLNEAFRSAVCTYSVPHIIPYALAWQLTLQAITLPPNGAIHKVFHKTCIILNYYRRITLRTRISHSPRS